MFTSTLLSNEKWKGSHSNGKKLKNIFNYLIVKLYKYTFEKINLL